MNIFYSFIKNVLRKCPLNNVDAQRTFAVLWEGEDYKNIPLPYEPQLDMFFCIDIFFSFGER